MVKEASEFYYLSCKIISYFDKIIFFYKKSFVFVIKKLKKYIFIDVFDLRKYECIQRLLGHPIERKIKEI